MAVKYLSGKRATALKSDIFSDSLGSSGDGSNSGVTLIPIKDFAVFDGTNDYITITGQKFNEMMTKGSFSVWINPASISNTGNDIIFDNADGSSSNNGFTIRHSDHSGGKTLVMYGIWGSTDSSITTDSEILEEGWQHLCVTYDGTTGKIYRNGVLQKSGTLTANSSAGSYDARIGWTAQGNNDPKFHGNLYQALVYSEALTQAEITALYNNGTPVTSPSTSGGGLANKLVSKYNLSSDTNDSQGSNNGTNTSVTFSTDNYKLGSGAYSFDGTDDYVVLTDVGTNGIDTTGDLSIVGWINLNATNANQAIISNDSNSSSAGINLYVHSSNQLRFGGGSAGTQVTGATGKFTAGTWYHVAVVKSGANCSLYVDGVQDGSTQTDWGTIDGQAQATIGAQYSGSAYGDDFNGKIDDLAIYKRALTTTEIGKLANNNSNENYLSATASGSKQLDESANKYGILLASNNPLIGTTLKSITFSMKKNSSPTGNVQAKIYKSDSTTATATSSTTLDASTLTTSFVDKTFEFASGVTLESGDRIVFEGGSHDGTHQIAFEYNSTSFTDTVSIARYTSSWVDGISGDPMFKLMSTNTDNAQLVSSLSDKLNLKAYYSMDTITVPTITKQTLDSTNGTTGWNEDAGANCIDIDTSNNEIDMTQGSCGDNRSAYYDLGADTAEKWLIRFKTVWTGNYSGSRPIFWIGVSAQNTIVADSTDTTTLSAMHYSENSSGDNGDGWKLSSKDGQHMDAGGTQESLSPSVRAQTGTYYVEIIKDGSNGTVTLYSDEDYTTSMGTYTVTGGVGSGMRYLVVITYKQGSGRSGSLSNVKFYNGVTSLSQCINDYSDASPIPNLPAGSIMESTSDGKHYMWNSTTSTWTEVA